MPQQLPIRAGLSALTLALAMLLNREASDIQRIAELAAKRTGKPVLVVLACWYNVEQIRVELDDTGHRGEA